MILTITLNPSIDRRYTVDDFEKGKIFRTDDYQYTVGGKGLNVTKVVKSLKSDVIATGFLGGSGGNYIRKGLALMDIRDEFVSIDGETRSCLAIISNDGSQTEILERGPSVSKEELEEFYKSYDKLLDSADIICGSGSLPYGLPLDTYKDIIKMAKEKDKKFLLDTSGEALKIGIEAGPYLVKPNKEELESLTDTTIRCEEDLTKAVKHLLEKDIEIVVVSLGHKGAMAFYKEHGYRISVPKIDAVSPVGSGDSMIAGFAVGIEKNYDFEDMLRFGAACGTANAMESETGKVDYQNVIQIMKEITIEKFKI